MLSVVDSVATLVDPFDLDVLAKEGAILIQVPFEELDDCSECAELDGPLPSVMNVVYRRYSRTYREPVCGVLCASQKLRDLHASSVIARPDFVHVHVVSAR